MEENDEHYITELAKSMKEELALLEPLSAKSCIYRVPRRIYDLNPTPYTPQVFSIGPFHHGKEELQPMEHHKRRYLVDFLQYTNANLEDLITCVKKSEKRLRDSYAEPIELKSEKFVKMVLVDAIFIITILLKRLFPDFVSTSDSIFNKTRMRLNIRRDMILLENQLPFFILEDLLSLSKTQRLEGMSMIYLTYIYFKSRWDFWVTPDVLQRQDLSQVEHVLDFLRICQMSPKMKPVKKLRKVAVPTASELYLAGVKFELNSSGYKLDVEFENGILKIPHFKIDYAVEILLRNLQAFEECYCHPGDTYFNDYIAMFHRILKNGNDVEILDQSGIIENWMQNEEAAAFFGNIDCTISRNNFYFSSIVEDLNDYYKNPWNKWTANLRQNYFNTPWAGISVAAAVFLLILTVIQTVCSILQVV